MKDPPELWYLTLRAEGEGPPVEIRVRRALKCLLRSFGLRCVSLVELPRAEAPPAPDQADGKLGK